MSVSDISSQKMKISREGIVLIKSFEGFRPRAIRREDGAWVIGYGHTQSAREGASVSEADAELLLRYDLLPVEKRVNETGQAVLNQHQFDALVSFARSVGLERFETSDVVQRLMTGATSDAADALLAWPELAGADAGIRRRAAERALFNADPSQPVALADLLVAPIALPEPSAEPQAPDTIEAASIEASEPLVGEDDAAVDPRHAAVSALLGEAPATVHQPAEAEAVSPFAEVQIANDVEATAPPVEAEPQVEQAPEPDLVSEHAPEPTLELETHPITAPWGQSVAADPFPPLTISETSLVEPMIETAAEAEASREVSPMTAQRYTPYATAMVGPLPYLAPAEDRTVDPAPATAAVAPAWPAETAPFAPTQIEPLSLSSTDDVPAVAVTRPVWSAEQRDVPASTDANLFGEDLTLTQGGAPILSHGDLDVGPPAGFDWSETGAFVVMGAVGLTAFGASMAAFRLAAEQSGGDETTIIAWVLAVIGAACVGVSSFNLYRRWGLPGGDA